MAPVGEPDGERLVLVVDDTDATREICALCVAHAGFRVAQACDGADALAKIAELSPDLVVIDLEMPVIDGWSAIQRIKTNRQTRGTPVIVLSAHARAAGLRRASKVGADVVLTKPCAPAALVAAIRRLLA